MCRKLKEIHKKTPEYFLANNFSIPVDIGKILHETEIEFCGVDFNELQKELFVKDASIDGMAYAHENDLKIFYSEKLDLPSRRFTLAHELGHCCLHMNDLSLYHIEMQLRADILDTNNRVLFKFNQKKEDEADKFARDILMPTDSVLLLLKHANISSVDELAKIFCVSPSVAEEKLNEIRCK